MTGAPAKLIKEDQPWEGNLIEAPTLFRHGSRYYLFYSANAYNTCDYAVGYAVADSVTGPYTKPRTAAWLAHDKESDISERVPAACGEEIDDAEVLRVTACDCSKR